MLSVESIWLETLFARGGSIADVFVLKYGVCAMPAWKAILTFLIFNLLLLVIFEKIRYAIFVNFDESNFDLTVTFEVLSSWKLFINPVNHSLDNAFIVSFKHHIFRYSADLMLGAGHRWHTCSKARLATIFLKSCFTTIRFLSVVKAESGDARKFVSWR